MAFASVLGLGRGAALKTMQLKAWGLREFASTTFLSTKSGGNEKEKQKKSKTQQPSKNVVAPKEGVKLLPSQRAEFPKNLPSPNSYPSAVNKGKTIVNINYDDIKQQTDEEIGKHLPRKTVVEFPQRVSTSSLRAKDAYLATQQLVKKPADGNLSSSSDSDSDREDSVSEIVLKSQIPIKTKGKFPQQDASESRTQRTLKLTKTTQFQKAHINSTLSEKPHQSEMKLTVEQSETYKEPQIPKSEVIESYREQSTKEAQMQNSIFKLNEITKENQKPVEIHRKLSDQKEGRPSTKLDIVKEENREEKPIPVDFTAGHFEDKDILEEKIPIQNLEAPSPQTKEDVLEEDVPAVNTDAKEKVFQGLATNLKNEGIIQETETAEAFDNSTYKNLQHHNYNTYTFLDFNLDLLKFRLPQPSSGRESPRH